MASRNADGTQILQENNSKSVSHNGYKILIADSVSDTTSREDNTHYGR